MRITQGAMMRNYNRRLNHTLNSMNIANQKVITGRRFLSAAENPAGSAKVSTLMKNYMRNESYIENVKDVMGMFDVVDTAMASLTQYVRGENGGYYDIMIALNDPSSSMDEREIFAERLRSIQQSMILDCNAMYGDQFLFGGTNTKPPPPFAIDESGVVTYRGIDVNTTDPEELAKLEILANETMYVDFGFGLSIDKSSGVPNDIISNSAFNLAMPGISFLGFGQDEKGMPKNIIVLLGELADALDAPTMDRSEVNVKWDQLNKQWKSLLVSYTGLGSKAAFLDSTLQRLETNQENLEIRLQETAFENPAKLILDFHMLEYAYNSALKMGNSVLSPSFIDFMR